MFLELHQTTGILAGKRILLNCENATFVESIYISPRSRGSTTTTTTVYHNGVKTPVSESYDRIKKAISTHPYGDDFMELNKSLSKGNILEGRVYVNYKQVTLKEVGIERGRAGETQSDCRVFFDGLSAGIYIKEEYRDACQIIVGKIHGEG